jgi:aryl-alcohol dehydrogenase-like predicted oxidoreductase
MVPAQTALRFVLGNRDLSTRVIGISALTHLDEALAALDHGPLPAGAVGRLEALWATDFRLMDSKGFPRGRRDATFHPFAPA